MADTFPGRAVPIKKFIAEQPNVPWLVDKLLPAVGSTLLVGRMGIGKTTMAIQICSALYRGIPFMGRETERCNFAYVQVDSSDIEWRMILKRLDPESNAYTVVTLPSNCFDNTRYIAGIANLFAAMRPKPGFIVYDSLYRFSSVSVNTDRVSDTLEKFAMLSMDVPYMVLHHPPHDENRGSGHNSIEAGFSNVWYLTKTKLLIAKGRLVPDKEILIYRTGEEQGGIWKLKGDVKTDSDVASRRIVP